MLTGRHWRTWLGWLMLVVFVVVAATSLDWTRVLQEAAAAHYGWLTLAVLANTCILVLAAATWLLFLPKGGRVSPAKVFSIVAVMRKYGTSQQAAFFAQGQCGLQSQWMAGI